MEISNKITNKIKKMFPIINNYTKLQYDSEGLYSITQHYEADLISKFIISNNENKNKIIDCTAGLGGNTISFSKYFNNVTAIEYDEGRFKLLTNNISVYNLKNIELVNTDCLDYIKLDNIFDIYFFDPPWGGPEYKKTKSLTLMLNSNSLVSIVKSIKKMNINSSVIFKLPFNYNFNEFSKYNYKIYKINNYFIILI